MRDIFRTRGFSLIELLVVITIILILFAISLPVVGMLRRQAQAQLTSASIAGVLQALQVWSAGRGGSVTPAEHPLAGSAAPRAQFVRGDTHAAMTTTGMAYSGATPSQLSASDAATLMLPTDLFADATTPSLYGMARNRIGQLGVAAPGVTLYRLLPASGTIANASVGGILVQSNDPVTGSAELLDLILSDRRKDLAGQGLMIAPPDDTSLIASNRVWGPAVIKGIRNPPTTGGVRYQIRGLALYDVWGREVMYSLSRDGHPRLESAGPDGFFAIDPSKGGSAWSAADAARDNIKVGFTAGDN